MISDRRIAGTLLLSKVRLAERARRVGKHLVGAIGSFELVCHARRAFPNGFEATLILKRSDYDQELAVDPEQTPMGLIARLEHALERFEAEREEQTRREQDASVGGSLAMKPVSASRSPCRANSTTSLPAWRSSRPTWPERAADHPIRSPSQRKSTPQAMDQEDDGLRHSALTRPLFTDADFTATKWDSAFEKAAFANALCRFMSADFRESLFTQKLYRRLALSFGHIAHSS